MSFFDGMLLNMVCILFPLFCYLIYIAFRNNISDKNDYESVAFQLMLLTSIFLTIKLTGNRINIYTITLVNIPVLFSYLRCKNLFSLFLASLVCLYYIFFLDYNIYFVVFEYVVYYVIYVLSGKTNISANYIINTFTLVKTFFLSFYVFISFNGSSNFFNEFKNIFIVVLIFYLCTNLYYKLLLKGTEVLDLNNSLKELEKEKTLRKSLFKLTHEIKNPIAVCKGYLDMMNLNNKDNIVKYIPIIKSEINRTLVIMDDFLDYTKIKVNKNIMDINYLLEDTINSISSLLSANNVLTKFKVKDEEVFIDGDYNRLKQVLINVIKNAIESRKLDKQLLLSLHTKKDKESFTIIITDNGIGMDLDELNMLGETFYTTKENGTGLGVTLSKEIIGLHAGTLKYTSEKDRGTVVEIILPLINL